jgi:hypothetical protein
MPFAMKSATDMRTVSITPADLSRGCCGKRLKRHLPAGFGRMAADGVSPGEDAAIAFAFDQCHRPELALDRIRIMLCKGRHGGEQAFGHGNAEFA